MSVKIEPKLDAQGMLDVATPEPLFQTHVARPPRSRRGSNTP